MISAKGYAAPAAKQALAPFGFERRDPKPNDVVIDIKFCGVCHSDVHQVREEWGTAMFPMVPGHEVAGVVCKVGSNVTKYKVGDHVGVGCFVDSCRTCDPCINKLDQYCLEGNTPTYNGYERDHKSKTYGGYSDVMVVDENYVLGIPKSIPLDKAAPLLCAGITLFSPLNHWHAKKGKKVAIMGLGGLGHMGVKLAAAMGADVTVLSHSEHKKENALKMGAHHFISTKNKENLEQAVRSFDLIINTISVDINMSTYFNLLKLDGALVTVGVPDKPLAIQPFDLIGMRRTYAGSMIGSISETQEMLNFCAKHHIVPDIEVIDPKDINVAYERMTRSDVKYRFVLDMSKL